MTLANIIEEWLNKDLYSFTLIYDSDQYGSEMYIERKNHKWTPVLVCVVDRNNKAYVELIKYNARDVATEIKGCITINASDPKFFEKFERFLKCL